MRQNWLVGAVQTFIIVIIFVSLAQIAPAVDGIFNPVVSNWSLEKVESLTEEVSGPSTLEVTYTKIRECDYVGVQWFFGTAPGASAYVAATRISDPNILGIGDVSAVFEVGLSKYNILNNSYSYIVYDCYNGWLWVTKTPFVKSTSLDPSIITSLHDADPKSNIVLTKIQSSIE